MTTMRERVIQVNEGKREKSGLPARWRGMAIPMSLAVLLCVAMLRSAVAAPLPEIVHFPSLDEWDGDQPLRLDGYYFRPETRGPAPAVVMLHGCAGAVSSRTGRLTSRFVNMTALLNKMGYAVLVVDSFNPRGVPQICTIPFKERKIRNIHRVRDAYGALAYLEGRPDIVHGKIGVIGFSHGGSGALSVMDSTLEPYRESGRGFAASVAMYPGCGYQLRKKPEFSAYAPLLILVGEKDDWTPAESCVSLAARSRSRDEPVDIVVYPGAYHGFDETQEVHVRMGVANGVNGDAGTHVGGNPEARKAAYARIREFFKQYLRP